MPSSFEERVFEDAEVKLTPAAWSTSGPMLARLKRSGVDAWEAHIRKQLTRRDLERMSPEQVMAAQKAGRLDRLLATGA